MSSTTESQTPPHHLNKPPPPPNPFDFSQVSIPYQLTIFVLVLCPLLLMRRFERPKRRFSVWVLDLSRFALGYTGAEILLIFFVLPYTRIISSVFLFDPNNPNAHQNNLHGSRWRDKGDGFIKDTSSRFHNSEQEYRPGFNDTGFDPGRDDHPGPHERRNQNHDKRGFGPRFVALQSASLTLSLLELFPGIFVIFAFYWICLYFFYFLVRFWKKKLRSPRVVFRRRRRCLPIIVRGPKHVLPEPANTNTASNNAADRFSRQKLGFVSGFYGFPIKARWFLQQTLCFLCAVIFTRIIIIKICQKFPDQARGLHKALFSWNMKQKGLHMFLLKVLFPALIYMVQICISDLVLRFRSKTAIKYSHNREFQPMFSASGIRRRIYPYNDDYELQELTLPVLTDYRNNEPRSSITPTPQIAADQNHNRSRDHNVHSFMQVGQPRNEPVIVLPNDGEGTSAAQSTIVSGLPPTIHDPKPSNSITSSSRPNRSRPQLGIVTASLLNTAAVTATAASRANIFNSPSRLASPMPLAYNPSRYNHDTAIALNSNPFSDSNNISSSVSTSTSVSDTEVDSSSTSTGTTVAAETQSASSTVAEPEPRGAQEEEESYGRLPSYDDSQRQHQELLRDPEQAGRHQVVINGMKQ